jgi:hypothetical protein
MVAGAPSTSDTPSLRLQGILGVCDHEQNALALYLNACISAACAREGLGIAVGLLEAEVDVPPVES